MKARIPLIWLVAGLIFLGASSPTHPVRIIFNRTNSVPRGLYIVQPLAPDASLEIGDMVAFSPEPQDRKWLESRAYIGKNWPLLKYVAALPGDTVCRHGATLRINQLPVAHALQQDGEGRALPVWQGCLKLTEGDVFLLTPHPRSLDGRYLGIQKSDRILGKAGRVLAWGKSGTPPPCSARHSHIASFTPSDA